MGIRRVTRPTMDVLRVLVQSHAEGVDIHGWALMKAAHHSGPTVYGVLDRLEEDCWVSGRWEDNPVEGRPRRRFYRLTPVGAVAARSLIGMQDAAGARDAPP